MYERLEEPQQSFFTKFYRNLYPIVSISLLNYTMSNTYSLMTNGQEATGFISIIISSLVCFTLSESHLTIYGVSILSIVYINMIQASYTTTQISVITFLAGLLQLPLWQIIHAIADLFRYLPGKIHAGMVLGVGFIVLAKPRTLIISFHSVGPVVQFFPLAIENIAAFFNRDKSLISDPLAALKLMFQDFNVASLALTIFLIIIMFLLRNRLAKFPSVLIIAIIGILLNIAKWFSTYESLCSWEGADCDFYLLKLKNVNIPRIQQLLYLLPVSVILTGIIALEQFLYIEEFSRRGRQHKGEGDLGDIRRETKVLCISNMMCGVLGGFPVCINLFATYQNYAFNRKSGFRGTKVVGLSQIFFNYLLYSLLKPVYDLIPLFAIFCIIAIPMIYFFKTVYRYHFRNIKFVLLLGVLNVLTHPVFALIIVAFYTIYEMAQQLRPAPAEIIMQSRNQSIKVRDSTTFDHIIADRAIRSGGDEYYAKVIAIDDDMPPLPPNEDYLLYRFSGSISFLNFFQHEAELQNTLSRRKQHPDNLLFSFRYVQSIDEEALEEFEQMVKGFKELYRGKKIIITGLHSTLLLKFREWPYLMKMLEEEDNCFYRIHGRDLA